MIYSCPIDGCPWDLAEDGADLRCPDHGVIPDYLLYDGPAGGGVSDPFDLPSYDRLRGK